MPPLSRLSNYTSCLKDTCRGNMLSRLAGRHVTILFFRLWDRADVCTVGAGRLCWRSAAVSWLIASRSVPQRPAMRRRLQRCNHAGIVHSDLQRQEVCQEFNVSRPDPLVLGGDGSLQHGQHIMGLIPPHQTRAALRAVDPASQFRCSMLTQFFGTGSRFSSTDGRAERPVTQRPS